MKKFPKDLIKPKHAVLRGKPSCAYLEVFLAPFNLNGELVDTSIRLDGIDLPSTYLVDLVGKRFSFPTDPIDEEEEIDGSIYLGSAHHPCDVSSLEFLQSRHNGPKVLIRGTFIFEFEGLDEFENTDFTIGVSVSSCAV